MALILKSPAVIYRQLLRFTGISNSLLSYILRNLETSKHIVVNRGDCKRTTNYFPKNMGTKEAHVMTSLTNNTNREIVQCRFLLFLLQPVYCYLVNTLSQCLTLKEPCRYWHRNNNDTYAPCECKPTRIANWCPDKPSANCLNNMCKRLVFSKESKCIGHGFSWYKGTADKGQWKYNNKARPLCCFHTFDK
jgi:hypothetical protein